MSSESVDALNQAMKYLQGGRIDKSFSAWLCKLSYIEGGVLGPGNKESEYEVEFHDDSNNPWVSVPAFEGINRHVDFNSRFQEIDFDETLAILTIKGASQKTRKNYELKIFLGSAKEL